MRSFKIYNKWILKAELLQRLCKKGEAFLLSLHVFAIVDIGQTNLAAESIWESFGGY